MIDADSMERSTFTVGRCRLNGAVDLYGRPPRPRLAELRSAYYVGLFV